jgi:uncharacterized Zn finger protein
MKCPSCNSTRIKKIINLEGTTIYCKKCGYLNKKILKGGRNG